MLSTQVLNDYSEVWDLLLLADPSEDKVRQYLSDGICLGAKLATQANDPSAPFAAVAVITSLAPPNQYELMNIAVAEDFHGQGLGKAMLAEVITLVINKGAVKLELGTGNSSIDQLAFYQKAGFRIVDVWQNFFLENYDEEIIENGIPCRDMIRLAMTF